MIPPLPPRMMPSVPEYQAKSFTWCKGNGSAFVSDIAHGKPLTGQVWEDSCDSGFIIRNEKTGRAVLFTLIREESKDGDVKAWHFESYSTRRDSEKFTVTVFNT